jgi:hypothetical protein
VAGCGDVGNEFKDNIIAQNLETTDVTIATNAADSGGSGAGELTVLTGVSIAPDFDESSVGHTLRLVADGDTPGDTTGGLITVQSGVVLNFHDTLGTEGLLSLEAQTVTLASDLAGPHQGVGVDTVNISAGAQIQDGIDIVSAGGTVHVGAGTFAGGVTIATADVSLLGTGHSATTIVNVADHGFGVDIAADNVTVDGFKFQGSGDATTNDTIGVRVSDPSISGYNATIGIAGGDSAGDDGNLFDNLTNGIKVNAGDVELLVQYNTMTGIGRNSILFNADITEHVTIAHNDITVNGPRGEGINVLGDDGASNAIFGDSPSSPVAGNGWLDIQDTTVNATGTGLYGGVGVMVGANFGKVTIKDSSITGTGADDDAYGMGVALYDTTYGTAEIDNSVITGAGGATGGQALFVNNVDAGGTVTVTNSTITTTGPSGTAVTNAQTAVSLAGFIDGAVSISDSAISAGNKAIAIGSGIFNDGSTTHGSVKITRSLIEVTGSGADCSTACLVDNSAATTKTVDASANWWGLDGAAATPTEVADHVSGPVDFSPMLSNKPVIDPVDGAGVTADLSELLVHTKGTQSDPGLDAGTYGAFDASTHKLLIQEGIELADNGGASAGLVHVDDGTYEGGILLDQDHVKLQGTGFTHTTIVEVASNSSGVEITAANDTVDGFLFKPATGATNTTGVKVTATGDSATIGVDDTAAVRDGNGFEGLTYGIVVDGGADGTLIKENVMGDDSTIQEDGIRVDGTLAGAITITDNLIKAG